MGYVFYANGEVLWQSDSLFQNVIGEPTLKLELNKAGSGTCTIMPNHTLYDQINRYSTIITIEEDGDEIFRGRVILVSTDAYKCKKITYEGDLAYLLDSQQAPFEVSNGTSSSIFTRIINAHNSQMNAEKRFTIGTNSNSTVKTDYKLSSYQDTSGVLDDLILGNTTFCVRTRRQNNTSYIDIAPLSSFGRDFSQLEMAPFTYGVNVLEFDYEDQLEELFTVLLPVGYNGLTISSANSGSPYIQNAEFVNRFGPIIRAENFDDCTTAAKLKTEGQAFYDKYMSKLEDKIYNVKAVDINYVYPQFQKVRLHDKVMLNIQPHDILLERYCIGIEYDFQNPENTQYRLGDYIPPDPKRSAKSTSTRSLSGRSGGSAKSAGAGLSSLQGEMESQIEDVKKDINVNANDITVNARNIEINAEKIQANADEIALRAKSTDVNTELRILDGKITAEVTRAEDAETSIGTRVQQTEDDITSINGRVRSLNGSVTEIQGSALWQRRDSITTAAGKLTVDTNGDLHVVDGSRLYVGENAASMAVFTDSNLTAGVIVSKVNGGSVQIDGNKVNITDTLIINKLNDGTSTATINASKLNINDNFIIEKLNTGSSTATINASKVNISDSFIIDKLNNGSSTATINASRLNINDSFIITKLNEGTSTATIDASRVNISNAFIVSKLNDGSTTATINANRVNISNSFIVSKLNDGTSSATIRADKVNINNAFLVEKLNDGSSNVKINANKLNLSAVELDIDAIWTDIGNMKTNLTVANNVVVSGALLTSSMKYDNTTVKWVPISFRGMDNVEQRALSVMAPSGSAYHVTPANLPHSHAVTVNSDGTITLGGVSRNGGSFKIADTKVYKDGVSAVEVSKFAFGSPSFDSSTGKYTISASVELSNENDTNTTGSLTFTPTDAINSVTIKSDGWSGSLGSYSSSGKSYPYTVTATASNGKTGTHAFAIDASAAFDAGESSVSVSSWGTSASTEYDSKHNQFEIHAQATLSNGAVEKHDYTIGASAAYNAGSSSVGVSSWTTSQNTGHNTAYSTYTVYARVVLGNSKASNHSYSVDTSGAVTYGKQHVVASDVSITGVTVRSTGAGTVKMKISNGSEISVGFTAAVLTDNHN